MYAKSLIFLLMAGLASCSDGEHTPSAPPAATAPAPSPEELAVKSALEAYEGYWRVSTAAEKEPRAKDWRPPLSEYVVDPLLTRQVAEIQNLASVPAHMVGEYRRSPRVTSKSLQAQDPRIKISDCLDRSSLHLVSDKPSEQGRVLDNPDQPRRYEFRAEVVRYAGLNDRWLVQVVEAALDTPC
ncbi:hypothetical protein ACFQ68_07020 [Amycolatopsis japonica]|uniref:hypothetical protein n=1 Tax=Amycolatopsis japonica TaxID=208439 RepID=UPI00366FAE5A